jgi:transposase-like protein
MMHMTKEAIRGAIQYEHAQGKSYREIAKKFGCTHKTVSKWANRDSIQDKIRERKPKFNQETVNKIVEMAENKTTGTQGMSSRAIAEIINDDFEKNGIKKTISPITTNRILLKNLGKPMNIRKTFFLSDKDKEKRFKFSNYILENGFKGRDFIFTDEKYFYLKKPYNRQTNKIRLSRENRRLIRKGNSTAIDLLHFQVKGSEPSVMVCGGICGEGVTNLYFCIGNMDSNSYCQVLDGFKYDINILPYIHYHFKSNNNISKELQLKVKPNHPSHKSNYGEYYINSDRVQKNEDIKFITSDKQDIIIDNIAENKWQTHTKILPIQKIYLSHG